MSAPHFAKDEGLPSLAIVEAFQSATPAKVLVVDDEPHNLEVVANLLEMDGFRVATALEGDTALQSVAADAPDLILLDVLMPGRNGFEICRQLKSNPATVFIPVVILTALRGTDERIKGAAAGADEFLSKPFDHVELKTRVKSLVRVKRLYDKLQNANAQLQNTNQELERRVTERTAELQRALTEIQGLDRLKSEFIANVSHELRTPLLHVKGYVDLLANGILGALTSDQAHGLSIAQGAIEQLERIVKDTVNFSDVYDQELNFEVVGLPEVFETALESLTHALEKQAVRVVQTVAPTVSPVWADPDALVRVLRHLLDNAIKFSPPHSEVRLMAELRGDTVRVTVQDTGPGIPADKREHIFDLFYQGDGSSTRRAGGLGLGLPLARKLLEGHKTTLHLETEMGRGCRFYFDLPKAR